ncbi:hypothetical protein KC19_3G081100 [Ceratodon purpureus]|uniref:Uncharacterized protein n=1 Tax=Ceratodon purpureus TaxID=3225 RepID=A0A8T0III3_CERPU|nr:hypothetical protein KC19_3G081100 [Ceratodon purpureus]
MMNLKTLQTKSLIKLHQFTNTEFLSPSLISKDSQKNEDFIAKQNWNNSCAGRSEYTMSSIGFSDLLVKHSHGISESRMCFSRHGQLKRQNPNVNSLASNFPRKLNPEIERNVRPIAQDRFILRFP